MANDRIHLWEAMATQSELPLVIDSAAGFGSTYPSGEALGARGTCEIFSFHATKTLAIGEGGMIASRSRDLIESINRMKNFGFDSGRQSVVAGTNAKLSEMSCAIGIRQLAALSDRLTVRRNILRMYREGLAPLGLEMQPLAEYSALPFVSALCPSIGDRALVQARLEASDIETRNYYNPPVHVQPFFSKCSAVEELSTTLEIASRVLSLPISLENSSRP